MDRDLTTTCSVSPHRGKMVAAVAPYVHDLSNGTSGGQNTMDTSSEMYLPQMVSHLLERNDDKLLTTAIHNSKMSANNHHLSSALDGRRLVKRDLEAEGNALMYPVILVV